MTPTWSKNGVDLYLGDCRDVLPTLGKVDAVVTDPPYGVSIEKINSNIANGGYTFGDDSENFVDSVCVPIISKCIEMYVRVVLTPGIRNAWNYPKPSEIGCFFNPAGAGLGRWGFTCMHPILFYGPDPHKRTRPNSLRTHAITEENGHPCPKPIEYMVWLVERASLHTETILDPFMGSGTTGVACVRLGRKFIGIEIEPKYFDIAVRRIESAMEETSLLDYATAQQEELAL